MADKKITTPKGKTLYVPDDFTPDQVIRAALAVDDDGAADSPVGSSTLAPSHGKAPSKVGVAFDFITNLMSSGAMGNSGATKGVGSMLKTAKRELTDPENLSTAGGAIGGVAGGLTLGPAGAVGGAALGGTLASKFGEGKDWGSAMKEGAAEGAMEGVGGPAGAFVGRNVVAPAARSLTAYALRPSRAVMDALIDPKTGKQFATPGDAARFFRHEATGLMDQASGTPGGTTFANDLIGMDEADRAAKVKILEQSPKTVTNDQLVPPGSLDQLVASLAQRHGDAPAAMGEMDAAVQSALARSHPVMPVPPGQRLPTLQAVPDDQPWALRDVDRRMGGLQDDLNDLFAARQKAQMMGDSVQPRMSEEAKAAVRGTMGKALEQAEPAITPLNASMRRRIPITGAAIDSTMPVWGDAVPRLRIAGSPTNPQVQLFDYLRKAMGVAARPAHNTSKALQSGTGQVMTPQLLRLLNALRK